MYALDAQKWLSKELISGGFAPPHRPVFDSNGLAEIHTQEGVACLFCIPEHDARWYLFSHLREVEPSRDGSYLALALALNLQPQIVQGASIGLNLEEHQLLLQLIIDVEPASLNVKATIKRFAEINSKVCEELNRSQEPPKDNSPPLWEQERLLSHPSAPRIVPQTRKTTR